MSLQLPTLYSSYQECLLDLTIYGKILDIPSQTIEEMRESLFEEYKRRKPLPTLEGKRYELSRLVSPEYKIQYNKSIELKDNETIVDLRASNVDFKSVDFMDLTPLIPTVMEKFSYENGVTDSIREEFISKYDVETGELFKPGIKQVTDIQGTVSPDSSLELSDEDIEKLGVESEVEDEGINLEDFEEDGISLDDESEKGFEEEEFEDDSDDEEEYEDSDDTDEDYEDESDDDEEYEDSDDNDEDYEDDSDGEEEYEDSDDDDEEEYDDDEEYDDSDEDEEYEDDIDSDEDEEYDEDSDEDYEDDESEEDFDDEDYDDESEDDEDEYDDESDDDEDYDDESDGEEEYEQNDESADISEESVATVEESKSFELEDDDFEPEFIDEIIEPVVSEVKTVPKPSEISSTQVTNTAQPSNVIDRSSEPTDIRQFLRKHPNSDYAFVAQYFTKKQIDDALRIGKIIKRNGKLRI